MKEKKLTKVNLLTFFLVLAIIANIVMAGYIISDKTNADKVSDDKNNNYPSTTYFDITEELNEGDLFKVTAAINNYDGTFTLMGKLYVPYIISESELNEILNKGTFELYNDKFIIRKIENQELDVYGMFEGAYALCPENHKDVIWYVFVPIEGSKNYKLESTAEWRDQWKETEEYRQLTVSNSTKCTYSVLNSDDISSTVENVFANELYHGGYFELSFKNNKCVALNEVIIGY